MHDFDAFEDEASGTVFCDVVMLALAGFVVLVLLLPHLNPPGAKTADNMTPPGNEMVEVRWPMRSMPTSTSGCRRRAIDRSAIPTRAARCSTCCATISASGPTSNWRWPVAAPALAR